MNSFKPSVDQPFANEGGMDLPADPVQDPYQTFDDLMAVVEALCPDWPTRELFPNSGRMLL